MLNMLSEPATQQRDRVPLKTSVFICVYLRF